MTSPRVSVVMPVRDAESYVGEALASVLAQSLRELELVVVDDGSRDQSAAIVTEHAAEDSRVRLLRSPGSGIVAALNHGVAEAAAPLIARLDADDVALPDRLQRQVTVLEDDPATVLLGSAVVLVDDAGTEFGVTAFPQDPREELLTRNCFAHSTVAFRVAAFRDAGGYRSVFRHAEDYDLWLRLAELGHVRNLSEPLVRYRVHTGQVTRRELEEQARMTMCAQAAARARWSGRPEPPLDQLAVSPDDVRQGAVWAYVNLAAQRLDAGLVEDAKQLLAEVAATQRPLEGRARAAVLRQRARLARRRREHVRAALLALRAAATRVLRR